jgi:hypothetical protein
MSQPAQVYPAASPEREETFRLSILTSYLNISLQLVKRCTTPSDRCRWRNMMSWAVIGQILSHKLYMASREWETRRVVNRTQD